METTFQFEELLVALTKSGVDFAVVGGLAVGMNGYARATKDADIIVSERPDNIGRLLECLANWGEGWARELKIEEFVPQEGSIRVVEDYPLDIFTRMRGKSIEDFRPRLRYFETMDTRIPYLAPEDLIHCKEGSWRDRDQRDVHVLKEIIRLENQS